MYRVLFHNELDDEFGFDVPFTPLRNFPLIPKEWVHSVLKHLHKVSPVWMSYTVEPVEE